MAGLCSDQPHPEGHRSRLPEPRRTSRLTTGIQRSLGWVAPALSTEKENAKGMQIAAAGMAARTNHFAAFDSIDSR